MKSRKIKGGALRPSVTHAFASGIRCHYHALQLLRKPSRCHLCKRDGVHVESRDDDVTMVSTITAEQYRVRVRARVRVRVRVRGLS